MLLGAIPGYAENQSPVPITYAAQTSWQNYPKPPLPKLGPAGFTFKDPTFGSRILRLTDPKTLVGTFAEARDASFATPLYGEPNAWNSDNTLFIIQSGRWTIP